METELKRITPDMVKAATKSTGLRLVKGTCGNGSDCGCPLMVIYRASPFGVRRAALLLAWAEDVYGRDYMCGFIAGVDEETDLRDDLTERQKQGLEDGRAVLAELFGGQAA